MKFCPYAQRALLVLDYKKIPYHTININLSQKPEWFQEVSALGNIPSLEIPAEKASIIESLIICDYLDEKYPENPLHSKDPLQRARDRILIDRFNGYITNYYRIMFNYSKNGAPGAIDQLLTTLDVFENEPKTRGSKFLGGSEPNMVDFMIWPWCQRFGKKI